MFLRDSIHPTTSSRLRRLVIVPIIGSCDVALHLLRLDQPIRMRHFSLPSRSTHGLNPPSVVHGCAGAAFMRSAIESRTGLSRSPACASTRHVTMLAFWPWLCKVTCQSWTSWYAFVQSCEVISMSEPLSGVGVPLHRMCIRVYVRTFSCDPASRFYDSVSSRRFDVSPL